ncbi:AAA family ATPase [Microcoleus sp. LAD1_D5]|uniref:AAA family ATPase n=1 Tax=unclassified Microcoleus TaxID=2642155 RepID=UPI002FD761FE
MDLTNRISGYNLVEQLYCGSRTLVYRAIRETDQFPVVIKLLNRDYPSFSELLQFRNQYTIAKNLRLLGVVEPYNLESYRHSYALVMEDCGGISLRDYAQERSLTLVEILEIAIQITDILDGLYRNRVIHKDIKPANVLIHPETKQVKLIDFSIASLLPRETQEIQNPNVLEGTLAYISPEQTGRMNRGIDYRTDFYSLGVTFYELLTGKVPFECDDPMELVHCHIAKQPPAINSQEIPQVVSDIVMKLMAKNAEKRYQSALGLKHDLEIGLAQLQKTGNMETFGLGTRDITDRFLMPEKLYGRETEVDNLLAAFERVSAGCTEMMLVAGFSGIGKTAVVNEVHKPIVRQRGYFIKGKYDQFQRNIPFSAFVQAFRDLMGQLLSESDAQLQSWKTRILSAVGDNGQVLIEVIPELERIIGTQPPAPELSGSAAQNRFNLLMQKFVQVFTTKEHPLVIFLDDLQWADSASLKLLQLLIQDTGHLLVLGAYRDNEVSPVHPFILTVDEIVKAGATVNTITLQPLSLADMNQLVANTLNCDRALAQPLTHLVYQKTKGNPFFATQFLKALHDDELITFDWNIRYWQCDIAQVRALALTDDVVEFMALQLQKLPIATQSGLKLAACIGAQFDIATLAIASEKLFEETAADLWKALQEGLLVPTTEIYKFFTQSDAIATVNQAAANANYKFLHDRVQQAAYSLIPDSEKKATHLKIGQLLLQNSSEIQQEEKLFDIVRHLNQGEQLFTQQSERETLAQLNLKAGQKARNSTAYSAANIYLQTGIELLTVNCWQAQYELTINLYVAAAEAAYLNADLDCMEQMAALVLQEAQTILDKIKIYKIQIVAQTAQSKLLEAIAVARDALLQLGVELPTAPDEAKISKALQTLAGQQSGRRIEELIDLPVMSDRQTQAAMELLGMLFAPVFQGMPGLMPILSATMVSLSLSFGNTPASTVGYAIHAMVLCAFLEEVETGYSFGRLSLNLLDGFNVREFKCTVLLLFGGFIQHRQESLRAMMLTVKDGYAAGMETGDFLNAGYCLITYFSANLFGGVELETWEPEIAGYRAVLVQTKQYSAQTYLDITQQAVQNLRETRILSDCLIGDAYDETVMIPKHHRDNDLTGLALVYIYKLLLAYSYGNYPAALNYICQVKLYLMALSGLVYVPIFHFYAALTHLALFPTQLETDRAEILDRVQTHQTPLQQWAQNAPMNHLHKWYLVEAEKHRVLGNKAEAIDLYDRAIQLAKENQFLQEEALANELAAKFYLDWGKEKVAASYMQEAYYCYARWGAKAKIEDLEQRYPQLLQPILNQPTLSFNPLETLGTINHSSYTSSNSTSISHALDFASIVQAAQALSSKIQIDELLGTLNQIILKTSGAETCALLLPHQDEWQIRAITHLNPDNQTPTTLLQTQPIDGSAVIPLKLIYYVKHTRETVVIEGGKTDIPGLMNDCTLQYHSQSMLCTPILDRGNLVAILYLEHSSTKGVFTRDRLLVLNFLCTQAAISLENARLYQQAQDYAHQVEQSQLQLVQSEKMSALGNLVAGVAHEINNPVGFISGNIHEAIAAVKDLTKYLQLYQEKFPHPGDDIEQIAEELDIEYLVEDLPKMLNSMQVGCDRIQGISTSLRTFSRSDKDYKVPFNIHDGINSTILILKHRLKANEQRPAIEVVKEYGNLPSVDCFPGQLNQVFMNILANAIDALEESNREPSLEKIKAPAYCITIRTERQSKEWVLIRISDNGPGIADEIKANIFDHLFTTKGVGKGTGLGLAIARQIVVEKHSGILEVYSTLGRGTEFTISLPC